MSDTTLVVLAERAQLARDAAETLGPAGKGMWQSGLRQKGTSGEASHFISHGQIGAFGALLKDGAALHAALTESGGSFSREDIDALLATSVIAEDVDPHALIDSLDLEFVPVSLPGSA